MRPLLIGLCLFIAAILLPETIIANALQNVALIAISNILLAAVLLFIFSILGLAGFRLVSRLHAIKVIIDIPSKEEVDQEQPHEDVITLFIFRVRWYLLIIGISMAFLVVALVVYALTDARYNQWPFLVFQVIYRVFEFTYLLPTLLLLVQRKRPSSQRNESTTNGETMSNRSAL